VALFGMQDAGRWTLVRRGPRARTPAGAEAAPDVQAAAVEHLARTLLERWGVMFWKLYQREAAWLPPWRDLLMVYRRLEARGDIRGGRFVAGFSGEQYALPAAISALRETRRRETQGEWVSISAADPLNLVGLLTPGARVPALTRNRVLYRDGVPVATLAGGDVAVHEHFDDASEWDVRNRLLRRPSPRKAPGHA
jgi:ATP-dependent Lhr-like helicase